MSKRLLFPAFFINPGRVGGVEYAAYNFLIGCAERGQQIGLHVHKRTKADNRALATICRSENVQTTEWRLPKYIGRFVMEELMTLFSPPRSCILFFNYFLPFATTLRRDVTTIVLIHDFLVFDRGEGVHPLRRYFQRLCISRSVRRSHRLLYISEFTKQRAVRYFGPSASRKGLVVYNGVVWHRPDITERISDLVCRYYVLVVSNDYPHKNLTVVIEAVRMLRNTLANLELIVIGKPMSSYRFMRRSPSDRGLGLRAHPDYRFLHVRWDLSAGELAALYERAALVAFPSLYEGFGLPAVEALGYGAPLLTTREGALPEVAGSAAQYVTEPTSARAWAEAMRVVLGDADRFRPSQVTIARIRARFAPSQVVSPFLSSLGD